MNTVEAAESRTAAKAPGMIEEEIQKKIDEGLARLVMVDKLTTAWGKAFSELAAKAINGLKTYPDVMLTIHRGKRLSNAINALEEVREVEVNRIRELQHWREALLAKAKDLVPPLELCQRIPKGKFADTALVWASRFRYCGRKPELVPKEYVAEVREIAPAPTLQEIMAVISFHGGPFTVESFSAMCGVEFLVSDHQHIYLRKGENPAELALQFWLDQLNEAGMIPQKGEGE